jgi:hypothetical protein
MNDAPYAVVSDTVTIEPLGVIDQSNGYGGLVEFIRRRAADLNVTMSEVDERAGIARGYVSKCASAVPIKAFGLTSLGSVLGALGLRLFVAIDPDAKPALPVRKLPRAALEAGVKLPIQPAVLKVVRPVVRSADASKAAKIRRARLSTQARHEALADVRAHKRPRKAATSARFGDLETVRKGGRTAVRRTRRG